MSPGAERLVSMALMRAPRTKSVVIRASIASPTTSQVWRSLTLARYNQPSAVGTYVISVTQASFGRLAAKVWANTFAAVEAEVGCP